MADEESLALKTIDGLFASLYPAVDELIRVSCPASLEVKKHDPAEKDAESSNESHPSQEPRPS